MNKKQKKVLKRIIVAAVLLVIIGIAGSVVSIPKWLEFLFYLVPYFVIGYDILRKAWKGICNRQMFDENFLMAVATIGAIALGDYKEGVAVMLFYQIGELFQSYAVGKSRRNISDLMDIRPDYANIETDGQMEKVDPDEVEIGTVIIVQPGEKVPIDGVVVEGHSSLNTSALTGESVPREVAVGEEIISGCINISGLLKIRTTKEFGESTVSKILDLVENASSKKSRSENFISRFAHYYTPAVCYGALALAILPPLVRMLFMGLPADWGIWIYRALTFLVISCPCALVISIPLSFFAGIGGASAEGVLVKGSNYLEALAGTRTVVFDKTGTITQGVFEVCGIHGTNCASGSCPVVSGHPVYTKEEEQLLEYAALAECHSTHPISVSLQKAYGRKLDVDRVTDVQEIGGHGVIATVDGHRVAAGNDKLMKKEKIAYRNCSCTGTIVHLAVDGAYAGHILISDMIKPNAAAAMQAQIAQAKAEQDSVGGVIECVIEGLPAGIGDPMFGGLENRIARTVFAIPAVKGVEFGAGFAAARLRGSENNDPFCVENGKIVTKTNHCGGILGGISNGMPVVFRAAFKPTPSISREQDSVSLSRMEETKLVVYGRHDPCIVPRAVPCVEAAAAIAVLDAVMERKKELGYGY